LNLLLDTHIAIWAVEDNPRLSAAARVHLTNPQAKYFVSVVSLWEIAIKHTKHGVKEMPMTAKDALGFFRASGFDIVPVLETHAVALESLPRHHDDPFDRLLIATAFAEPYRLLTHDARLGAYGAMVTLV
jgi:PIN domain nuclease of toxin-antitoxin system